MDEPLTTSWFPPSLSELHLSDCGTAGAWLADDPHYVNLTTVVDLLRSLVPLNWTNATQENLLLWYDKWDEHYGDGSWNTAISEITDFVRDGCHGAICPYLQLEGDPDLAGIGVSDEAYFLWQFSP